MSSGKCKLKQQDITTHLLEWHKTRPLVTTNAGEDVGQQKLTFNAGENAKWYNQFGRVWQYLTKLDIRFVCKPAITVFGIYQNKFKTYVHAKPAHGCYSNFGGSGQSAPKYAKVAY